MRKLRENLLHWVWHFRGLALLLPIAVMVIVAGCVYPTVKDETSLMWTKDDWWKDVFSVELAEKWDSLTSIVGDEMASRDENNCRKAREEARAIAANRLPALMALRREMAAKNVAATKTKRKESMLQTVDELIADIRDAARDAPVLTLVPDANPKGVAFMGFDFDSEVEWDEMPHEIMDRGEDSYFLCREHELKKPYHGFETVEVRGNVSSRRPYALIFNREVAGEFDIKTAQRWTDELARDFIGDCGIKLEIESKVPDGVMLSGESDKLCVWVCAGAYSIWYSNSNGDDIEHGIQYQLDIRRRDGQ